MMNRTTGLTGLASLALAAGLGLATLTAAPQAADAGSRNFSLYVGPGGFGLSVGPRWRHRHYRRYHRPYYRGWYGPPRRYYYRKRRYGGSCHWKAKKCARNWGWHNRNWRGCMRYYGCR